MNKLILNQPILTHDEFLGIWARLLRSIDSETWNDKYENIKWVTMTLKHNTVLCNDCNLICFAIMRLLIKYVYPIQAEWGKFTIAYSMNINEPYAYDISYTLGSAIMFREKGINYEVSFDVIYNLVNQKAEEYQDAFLNSVTIRIYCLGYKPCDIISVISDDNIASNIWESILKIYEGTTPNVQLPATISMINPFKNVNYEKVLKPLDVNIKPMIPFIVADLETLFVNDEHVPYAAGLALIIPENFHNEVDVQFLRKETILDTYFSEDYPFKTFEERSLKVMYDFIQKVLTITKQYKKVQNVYFHNLSRFDGILLTKYLSVHHPVKYQLKTVWRNHILYEIAVYHEKKLLFRLRDSLTLLKGSLDNLASNLCPKLGKKGNIDHASINESNLNDRRDEIIKYLEQDIYMLLGVMLCAQYLIYTNFEIDIVNKLSVSSLALAIFRTHYYDSESFPIYIPNKRQDTFIRRGYYGGHADMYIPYGENINCYDVNSLYPFVMKEFTMPSGKPVWHNNLEFINLDGLYGFFEAHVVCPPNLTRPFLPYRHSKDKTSIIFPTGEWVGVYYSEELKFAKKLGYKVTPLRGYSFQERTSPFKEFVTTLYNKRLDAKKIKHDGLSFIYKLLMNSLYGRFGINPKSTVTLIITKEEFEKYFKDQSFKDAYKLGNDQCIVHLESDIMEELEYTPPRISSVQIAGAITACARIHMYPYISRPDCYYTDTDSIFITGQLSINEISQTELGKFKLENKAEVGIFLAAKSYYLQLQGISNDQSSNNYIIKHKGVSNQYVSPEWFQEQYNDILRTQTVIHESKFNIDWRKLIIFQKSQIIKLGIQINKKRVAIFDENNKFVATEPFVVKDIEGYEYKILAYMNQRLTQENEEIKKRNLELEMNYSKTFDHVEKDNIGNAAESKPDLEMKVNPEVNVDNPDENLDNLSGNNFIPQQLPHKIKNKDKKDKRKKLKEERKKMKADNKKKKKKK